MDDDFFTHDSASSLMSPTACRQYGANRRIRTRRHFYTRSIHIPGPFFHRFAVRKKKKTAHLIKAIRPHCERIIGDAFAIRNDYAMRIDHSRIRRVKNI